MTEEEFNNRLLVPVRIYDYVICSPDFAISFCCMGQIIGMTPNPNYPFSVRLNNNQKWFRACKRSEIIKATDSEIAWWMLTNNSE